MELHSQSLCFVGFICLFLMVSEITCKKGYILTFPQELQIGSEETFCMQLFNVSKSVDLTLNLTCYGRSIQHRPKTFRSGRQDCFNWDLPRALSAGTCNLAVKGEGDHVFTENHNVVTVDPHQITIIQTDKPVYKPKDTVKFRILTVTDDLKPTLQNVDSVTIHDPNDFYMTQWTDIQTDTGLVSLDYVLYDEPSLGKWKIVVIVDGRKTEQTFKVEHYVLPKFQVDMTLPTGITVATKFLEFEICARYVFGKRVEGAVNVTIELMNMETNWYCEEHIRPSTSIRSRISGCHRFRIDTATLSLTDRRYSLLCIPRLRVNATVIERGTGIQVTESQTGVGVWEERVKLTFKGDSYFKPFFPYKGKISAWNPDGSPAGDEEITLTIDKLGIKRILYTEENGEATFDILNLTHSTPYFVINAKTRDSENTNSKFYTIYPASTRKHVRQWYSPSSTYIQLSSATSSESVKCGSTMYLDVRYTQPVDVKIKSAISQIMSKGRIIETVDISTKLSRSAAYKPELSRVHLLPRLLARKLPVDDTIDIDYDDTNSLAFGPPGGEDYGSHAARPPASVDAGTAGQPNPGGPDNIVGLDDSSDGTQIKDEMLDRPAPELRHFTFKQYISSELAPKMRILVYMVTDTGEMIADTLDIDVEMCYENQVDMSFTKSTARPGEEVDIKLSARPGSLCSTTMVDKSVYLHGGLNLPLKSTVLNWLQGYDLTSDFINHWQYCSDLSILPPDMTHSGAPPVGPPGSSSTDFVQGPFRKRRSIMQYRSNMYDALLAFKIAGLTVMTDLDLQTRPCLHNGDLLGPPTVPGDPLGPIPGDMGTLDPLEPTEEPFDNGSPVSTLRKNFPDTWLWKLYEIPSNGIQYVKETLPDTITEWVGNSFCLSQHAGLGISDVAKITSFQPFFVSVKLPYSVIRGEVVNVDVMVFNYLPHCVAIKLDILENDKIKILDEGKEDSQSCFCSQKTFTHTFQIQPTDIGRLNITFSAFLREHRVTCYNTRRPPGYRNKQSTELVQKQLLVIPEGITEELTESEFICPQDSKDVYKKSITNDVASDLLVKGSLQGWVNIVGDIMGPVLNGLEDLILLPTGCGEQNMVRLAPNVAILHYLTVTQRLSQDMKVKTVDHLNKGYQQQLKFMHNDGSYSAFGTADKAGSTWLSAFVFKTFQQSIGFIYIDRKQAQTKTWEFLLSQQDADGCFVENGKVLGKYMMGGVVGNRDNKRRALTAYVLVAMLESFRMMREQTPPFVALAVKCIEVDKLEDTYTHALVAYAMALYKPNSKFTDILIDRLKKKAHIEDDKMFWQRANRPDILSGQGHAASAEIEMTSYALLAILTHDSNTPISEVMPIVRWLSGNRNSFGGFVSTQDTVVALQALAVFAERVYGEGLNVNVTITDSTGRSHDMHVTHDNSIILQQYNVPNPSKDFEVTVKGMGCILMQTTQRFNVKNKLMPKEVFKLEISTPVTKVTLDNDCRQRTIKICSSYHGPDDVSNMVVIEVKLISGWIAVTSTLEHLMNSVESGLKKYELDRQNPDVINLYFDELYSRKLCIKFDIVHEVEVLDKQPAMVKIFDYYESDLETVTFYELTSCTADNVDEVDISINDLYIETPHTDVHNELPAGPEPPLALGPEVDEGAPAPVPELHCPQCVTSGVVNILQDLCEKNVWMMTVNSSRLTLNVLMYDSVSPSLDIELPETLKRCQQCEMFLHEEGMTSLGFLKPYDWTDIGKNLAQQDTIIIAWSKSLQTSIQSVMESCGN